MIRRLLAALAERIDATDAMWPYRVRPYDMVGDRRRWWWEQRTPCQRGGILVAITPCPECSLPVGHRPGRPATGCADHRG